MTESNLTTYFQVEMLNFGKCYERRHYLELLSFIFEYYFALHIHLGNTRMLR